MTAGDTNQYTTEDYIAFVRNVFVVIIYWYISNLFRSCCKFVMPIKKALHFIKYHKLQNLTKISSLAFTVPRVPANKARLISAVHGLLDKRLMDPFPL